MTLLGQGNPFIPIGAATGWLIDSNQNDVVPSLTGTPQDLIRGIGRQPGSGIVIGRSLVNQLLPVGLAFVQPANGTETNTYTTRVAINGTLTNCNTIGDVAAATQTAGTFTAGALSLIGRTLRVRASGTLGATSTPNLTIDVALGSNILATTGVCAMATATSPAPWLLDVTATVQTAGSSGVVISEGLFSYSTTSSVVVLPWTVGNSTRGTGLSIDLTAAYLITVNATCGTSNSSNRIICNTMTVEVLF
jgi:hypothetical protein